MMFFANSEQAKGYALAQGETGANAALAAVNRMQAAMAARGAKSAPAQATPTERALRAALADMTERAQFFEGQANELCGVLITAAQIETELLETIAALRHELTAKKELLAQAISEIDILSAQIYATDTIVF